LGPKIGGLNTVYQLSELTLYVPLLTIKLSFTALNGIVPFSRKPKSVIFLASRYTQWWCFYTEVDGQWGLHNNTQHSLLLNEMLLWLHLTTGSML